MRSTRQETIAVEGGIQVFVIKRRAWADLKATRETLASTQAAERGREGWMVAFAAVSAGERGWGGQSTVTVGWFAISGAALLTEHLAWGEQAARGRSLRGWESQEQGLTGVCWPFTLKDCSHGCLVPLGNRWPFPFKPRCSITAYEHGKQSQKLTEAIGPNHTSLVYTRSYQEVVVTR